MIDKLPPGATEGETFVLKETQCQTCTHYISEHIGGQEYCCHVMYYLKLEPGMPPGAVRARQLCDCMRFEE